MHSFNSLKAQRNAAEESEKDDVQFKRGVRAFTYMVSCYHKKALNYKFKHERVNKFLSDASQWLNSLSTYATRFQFKWIVGSQPTKDPVFSLTKEIDIESTNRAYIASIKTYFTESIDSLTAIYLFETLASTTIGWFMETILRKATCSINFRVGVFGTFSFAWECTYLPCSGEM